ncbi:endo-1,4-beta-xylanase [Streptomyces sp. CRN 30]|uniref:endo-1,4-beta-xylanase n=1 Tax=Streptomyces sp. CRN 30 TaxID=3075613 RepID=UPI002A8293D3|nr:endo-1,4-beta-xylanase [Streptomyces sp. CRN 30]
MPRFWTRTAVVSTLPCRPERRSPRAVTGTGPGVRRGHARPPSAAYRRTAGEESSILTSENDFKPQFVQPRRAVFAFAEGDTLVDFAGANRMKVHGHTLVWFEALPAWMRAEI